MGLHWRLFEQLYESYTKRKAVERITRLKDQMVGALWANSNYDDDKGTRAKAITEIEENFNNAIKLIYGERSNSKIDWENDPFFAASSSPRIGYDYGVPSKEERDRQSSMAEAIAELDQT